MSDNKKQQSEKEKPFAYINGYTVFMETRLKIDERVYVPTPESHYLVETSFSCLNELSTSNPTVVDVGTGSGNIAIVVANTLPECKLYATDISAEAIEVAQENTEFHCCSNIELIETNLVDSLDIPSPDLVIANLPWGSPEHLLKSHTMKELSFMPDVAIFPKTGLLGWYVELIELIKGKKWRSTLLIETGVVPKDKILEELPLDPAFKYIEFPNYSVSKIEFQ